MMSTEQRGHFWLGVCAGTGVCTLLAAAWLTLFRPPAALAQVPDSGAQRVAMIKELRESNTKLAEIAGLLRDIRNDARGTTSEKPQTPPIKPNP